MKQDTQYQLPDGLVAGGMMMLCDRQRMTKAVKAALEYCDANPDFEPRFSYFANTLLNADEATKAMTQHTFKAAGFSKENDDQERFDLGVLAHAVLFVREYGWDAYVERVKQRTEDEKARDINTKGNAYLSVI